MASKAPLDLLLGAVIHPLGGTRRLKPFLSGRFCKAGAEPTLTRTAIFTGTWLHSGPVGGSGAFRCCAPVPDTVTIH